MPNYRGHLLGAMVIYGLIIFCCALTQTPPTVLLEWFLCMIFGSLFPDIDTKSMGQRLSYYLMLFIAIVLAIQKRLDVLGFLAFFAIIPSVVNHRGLFHRVWFLALLIGGITVFLVTCIPTLQTRLIYNGIFFFIGAVTHIWLDMGFKGLFKIR